jgi:CheY-like chemotaxis protein/HPt (histidine-containing phosphotransfer) domain-containing protein
MDDRVAGAPLRVTGDRRPISILLVDDQRFVGVALERLLAGEQDIELHCCLNALDAIVLANQIRPTLILQDLHLPEVDGLTMIRMFRANPPTAGTPIIVLSGNDDAETRNQAIAGGANDYLVKLPPKHDLVACIRRHAGAVDPDATAVTEGAQAASPDDPDETLDRRVIAEFRQAGTGGVPEFMVALIDQFIEEAASQVEGLRDAGERSDGGALKATAHSLKGSALTMGATRLAALCKQMESQADRQPGGAVTSALLAQLDQEFVKVRHALEAERQGQS